MKRLLLSSILIASPLFCTASVHVGLGVNLIGTPGFYGPIDVVNAPQPAVVYTSPRIAIPDNNCARPLYMRVPSYYYLDWPRYCSLYSIYNACYRPVYFIDEDWYLSIYIPFYRSHPDIWGDRFFARERFAGSSIRGIDGRRAMAQSGSHFMRNGGSHISRPISHSSGTHAMVHTQNQFARPVAHYGAGPGSNYGGNRGGLNGGGGHAMGHGGGGGGDSHGGGRESRH